MGIRRGNLAIFFHHVSPDDLLRNLQFCGEEYEGKWISYTKMDEDYYLTLAPSIFKKRNIDEQTEFYRIAMRSMTKTNDNIGEKSVYNMLYHYANDILSLDEDHTLLCRFDKILNWRTMSLLLGQDLFTCSFLAHRDVQNGTSTDVFSWSAILSTDNEYLSEIFKKGLAENHFHLMGSSRTFELNWIALMNNEKNISKISDAFDKPLTQSVAKRTLYKEESIWFKPLKRAAIIRNLIFNEIMGRATVPKDTLDTLADPDKYEIVIAPPQVSNSYCLPKTDLVLDYALTKHLNKENYNYNRVLVGERYFLYKCFKLIYENNFSTVCCNLLYLYLLIKSQFRGEMIQCNREVGFKTFSNYQKRKEIAIEDIVYFQQEQVHLAISETIFENKMKSTETRITPTNEPKAIFKIIDDIEKASCSNGNVLCEPCHTEVIAQNKEKSFFFVLHFPKQGDIIPDPKSDDVDCRNYGIRLKNKHRALAVAGLLDEYPRLRKIIRGIDGCSHEIGCRPEVMAQEFRFLSNFTPVSPPSFLFDKPESFAIKKTYHVGEDYMDITDGLRAIDEAIMFLGFKKGDRLGHALALGIDCEKYYENKEMYVIIRKQDLLDNICWLLCRSTELLVEVPIRLRDRLKKVYDELINEIYDKKYSAYEMDIYYHSWHLRGNNPNLYSSGDYQQGDNFIEGYNRWAVDGEISKSFQYSKSAFLYYAYHFDPLVRIKGSDNLKFEITNDFIDLIQQIQYALQKIIEEQGICIETNPTSNFLIGLIDRFDNHPLLRFYNHGLVSDDSELLRQISISINTDDQGIFDTKLENEYAIIASALERAEFRNGDKKYTPNQIYQWLDKIRQMGIEQSFNVPISQV